MVSEVTFEDVVRVLSESDAPLTGVDIARRLGDGVTVRAVNGVLFRARDDGRLVSKWRDSGCTRWEFFSLANEEDAVNLGYWYDWESMDTNDPAGIVLSDVRVDGRLVEAIRAQTGDDSWVEVYAVNLSGEPKRDASGGLEREIVRGDVVVSKREFPPGKSPEGEDSE